MVAVGNGESPKLCSVEQPLRINNMPEHKIRFSQHNFETLLGEP
jgi:hypothetical protein